VTIVIEYKAEIRNTGSKDSWNVCFTLINAQGFENGFKFKASNGITIIKSNEISLTTYAIFFDNTNDKEQSNFMIFPNAAIASVYLAAYEKALEELVASLENGGKKEEIRTPKEHNAIDLASLFKMDIWESSTWLFIVRQNKVIVNKNLLASLISIYSHDYYLTSRYLTEIELMNDSDFVKQRFISGDESKGLEQPVSKDNQIHMNT